MTATVAARMPSVSRLLAAQVSYQTRLLASGRAITIGVGFPVILLIASQAPHTHTSATDIASYACYGLTLTAWNTYGVRLVAAREAGVLKRGRATPLPQWCYFLGRILATVVEAVGAGAATVAAGVLLYGTHLTVNGVAAALAAFILGAISEPHWVSTIANYLPARPLSHAVGSALGHTAGHALLSPRDLIVLAAAGLAVAITTFRREPHRPTQQWSSRREASNDLPLSTTAAVPPSPQG